MMLRKFISIVLLLLAIVFYIFLLRHSYVYISHWRHAYKLKQIEYPITIISSDLSIDKRGNARVSLVAYVPVQLYRVQYMLRVDLLNSNKTPIFFYFFKGEVMGGEELSRSFLVHFNLKRGVKYYIRVSMIAKGKILYSYYKEVKI